MAARILKKSEFLRLAHRRVVRNYMLANMQRKDATPFMLRSGVRTDFMACGYYNLSDNDIVTIWAEIVLQLSQKVDHHLAGIYRLIPVEEQLAIVCRMVKLNDAMQMERVQFTGYEAFNPKPKRRYRPAKVDAYELALRYMDVQRVQRDHPMPQAVADSCNRLSAGLPLPVIAGRSVSTVPTVPDMDDVLMAEPSSPASMASGLSDAQNVDQNRGDLKY